MTEVPKIVYDRLRAASSEQALSDVAAPERAHPDANLLTTFAEQALSVTERDGVLKHLALCEDCREVLVLALPSAEAVTAPIASETESGRITRISTKAERSWLTMLAGPSMRWAALAAGVLVAASVLLVHPGKLNQRIAPSANQPTATIAATTASPTSGSPITSPPTGRVAAETAKAVADARSNSGPLLSKQLSKKQLSKKPDLGGNSSAIPRSRHSRGSAENAEISGVAVGVEAASSVEVSQMARNDAPAIEKAKPALPQSEATETASTNEQQKNQPGLAIEQGQTLARNGTWAITAGTLQRSLDNGQNWQNALRADHPLLCYASHREDVWTGGQAGTLFHSVDSGVTWVQLQPSIKGRKLSSDITHIDIHGDDIHSDDIHGNVSGPTQIVVFTSNNEAWTSADGGNTWQKN
jgi:hypothetical protein